MRCVCHFATRGVTLGFESACCQRLPLDGFCPVLLVYGVIVRLSTLTPRAARHTLIALVTLRLLAPAESAAGLVLGVELFDLVEEAGAHLVGLVDEPHGDHAVKVCVSADGADGVPVCVAETPDNIQGRFALAYAQ